MVSEPTPSTAISSSSMESEGVTSLKIFLKEFRADLGSIFASIRHDLSSINSSLDRCIDHAKSSRSTVLSESHHESPGFIDSDIVYEPRVVLHDEVSRVRNFYDPTNVYLLPTTPEVTRSDTSFQESPSESRSFQRVEGFKVGELSPSLPGSSLQKGIRDLRDDSGRFSGVPSSCGSSKVWFPRSSSNLSFHGDLDDSYPFDVDDRYVDGKKASEGAQVYSSSLQSQEAAMGMLAQMRRTAPPLRQIDDSVKEKENLGLQSGSMASSGLIDSHEPIVYSQSGPCVKIIQEPQPKSTVASAPVVSVLVDLNSSRSGSELTLSVQISQLDHLPCFVSLHDHQLFDRMPHMMVIFLNDLLTWEIQVQPGFFSRILSFLPRPPPEPPPTSTCLPHFLLSTTIEPLQDVQALETRSIENPNSTVGSQVDDIYGQDWVMEESFVIPGSATVASPMSILATSAETGGDAHKEPGVHLGDFSRVLPGLYSPTGCFSHGEIKIRSNSVIGSQSRVLPGAAVEENVIFGALSVAPSDATLQRGGVYLGSPTLAMVKNTLHDSDERVYRKIVGNLTANLAATTMKVKSRYLHQKGAEDNLREGMKHSFASFREVIPATEAYTQQHSSSFILDYFSPSTICLPVVAVNPIVQQHVGNSGVTFGVEIKSCVDASAISNAAGKTSSMGSSFPVSVVKVIPLRPPPKPPWLFHRQALRALQLWKYYDLCHMLINCSRGVTGFTRFALQLWTLKMHGTCSTKCCNVLAIVK